MLGKFENMFTRIDTTHERDRQTNRQTYTTRRRLYVASRGKNLSQLQSAAA